MSQAVENKKAEVLQIDPGRPEPLPVEFFSNRNRIATKLIGNADESNYMQGSNRTYSFGMRNPLYVSHIVVLVDGYSTYKKLEFRWKTLRDSSEHRESVKLEDNEFYMSIDDILTSFSIKPPKQSYTKPKIKKITVYGATLEELNKVMEDFGYIDRTMKALRKECEEWVEKANEAETSIATLVAREESLTTEIEDLTSRKADAEVETEDAEADLKDVERRLVAKRSEESDATTRIETINDAIDQKKKESEALNTEITQHKRELKALKDDVNMFPSEISGYVKQGSQSLKHYAVLALIPIGLLVLFVCVLFSNAVDLTTVTQRLEGIDLWTMFLSRIPFAVIAVFVITACYKIAKVFIIEYIRISNRRLDLTKVSIVAQDVSDSSIRDLDFDDDEIYELSTKLKMDMLKSHLKGYVADDYEYDIDVTLWDRFKRALAKKKSELEE